MAIDQGRVVYLKSGGPPMTVQQVVGELALVTWFGGFNNNERKHDALSTFLLTEHDPSRVIPASPQTGGLALVPRE